MNDRNFARLRSHVSTQYISWSSFRKRAINPPWITKNKCSKVSLQLLSYTHTHTHTHTQKEQTTSLFQYSASSNTFRPSNASALDPPSKSMNMQPLPHHSLLLAHPKPKKRNPQVILSHTHISNLHRTPTPPPSLLNPKPKNKPIQIPHPNPLLVPAQPLYALRRLTSS
jgi:hypothetical protein